MNKNLLGVALASTFIACGPDNYLESESDIDNENRNCHNVTLALTDQPETALLVDGYTRDLVDHNESNLLTAEIEICQGIRTRLSVISSNNGSLYLISNEEYKFGINLIDLETDTKISCIASENSKYVQYAYSDGINMLEVEVVEGNCD